MGFWDSLASGFSSGLGAKTTGGDFWDTIGSGLGNMLTSSKFYEGLGSIGNAYAGMQKDDNNLEFNYDQLAQNRQLAEEEMANRLEMSKISAGASGAANASAERRAKLAAMMDASGRRIDANFTGVGQSLSVINQMIAASKMR